MTKQDIFRYVLSTPENINPAILGQMLDKIVYDATHLEGGTIDELIDGTITNLIIPQGTVSIRGGVCQGLEDLENVYIPESVSLIDDSAFAGCTSLVTVEIDENIGIQTLPESMFEDCSSLENFVIPPNIEVLGDFLFKNCTSLETVTIPANIVILGTDIFDNCSALTDIYYGNTEEEWESLIGEYPDRIPAGVTVHFTEPQTEEEEDPEI